MHTSRTISQPPRRPGALTRGTRVPTICVVDPHPDGYQTWAASRPAKAVEIAFIPSAEAALHLARTRAVDVWVVNVELPGLSGFELCGMLKSRADRAPVYLVADEYSPEAERAAWAVRATLFGCKPGHLALLDDWLNHAACTSP